MTYTKPNGTPLTLVHHSLEEWASVVRQRLRALGCGDEYVDRASLEIEQATR